MFLGHNVEEQEIIARFNTDIDSSYYDELQFHINELNWTLATLIEKDYSQRYNLAITSPK